MSTNIRLGDYATTPLYNIKAVVQSTEISSSTLRAWERRYQMCSPQRSDSGYRLYSDRDIAKIRWLKAQIDAGMSISQAVAWLDRLTAETGGETNVVLPFAGEITVPSTPSAAARTRVRDTRSLRDELVAALAQYDEQAAEQVLAEAFALYPLEQVGEELIVPVLVTIGDLWHSGEISVTTEHYATSYLLQRLMALLHAGGQLSNGPVIWVGCPLGEHHEIGALLLAVFLRRAGYAVRYLGRNLPTADLVAETQRRRPAMVLFSAGNVDTAAELAKLATALVHIEPPRPIVGYGGRIYTEQPELRRHVAGVFLGHTAREAVTTIDDLLHRSPASDGGPRMAHREF